MVTDKALITVIVPVRNRAVEVASMLDSFASQKVDDKSVIKLILVDNASDDDTRRLLTRYAGELNEDGWNVELLHEPVPGASAARNCGLSRTRSEWVMWFDSDDMMLPGHMQRIVNGAYDNPDADIIGWDILWRSLSGNVKRLPFYRENMVYANMFYSVLATQRYMVKTAVVCEAGGWNVTVCGWNDLELGMRLIAVARDVVKLGGTPTVLAVARKQSITGTGLSLRFDIWEHSLDCCEASLSRNYGDCDAWRRWLAVKKVMLAAHYTREGSLRGSMLLKTAIHDMPSLKIALWLAYHYTRMGGRGVHRLFR